LFLDSEPSAIRIACATLLHETVDPLMLASTLGVILCVAGLRKFSA